MVEVSYTHTWITMGVFSLFLTLIIAFSSLRAVSCKEAVHSVLYLIFTFFSSSVLLLVAGFEVISLMLLVVYVGAVAILFLFVVMMIGSGECEDQVNFFPEKWIGLLLLALYPMFLFMASYEDTIRERVYVSVKDLGVVLYTKYAYLVHLSGVVLLFAMVAAVGITLPKKRNVKRQIVREQVSRSSEIRLLDIASGEGADYS